MLGWNRCLVLLGALASLPAAARAGEPGQGKGHGLSTDAYETVVDGRGASTGQTIEEPGRIGTSVTDAFVQEPAVWVEQTVRGEHLVNLLGFDQRRLLVTIQGVPLLLPYDGLVDLGRFPAGFVSRIRLRKGPSSLAFGPSGMGGSIDLQLASGLRTPRLDVSASMAPEGRDARSLAGGSYGSLSWSMGAQLTAIDAVRLSHGFRANDVEDGGLRENSDRRSGAVGLNLRLVPSRSQDLSFFAIGILGSQGVSPSTSGAPVRYWRFSDDRIALAGLAYRWHRRPWLVRSGLFFAGYGNTVDAFDDATYLLRRTDRSFHSLFRDASFGWYAGLQRRFCLKRPFPGDALFARAWADVRQDRHHQVLDGESLPVMETTLLRVATEAELILTPRHRIVGQLELRGEMPSAVLLSVRGEGGASSIQRFRASSVWTVNPLVSYQGRVGPLKTIVTAARRTRFPTLKERFSDGLGRRIPNPDLRPESAWLGRTEAGLPFWGMFLVRLSIFGALLDDLLEQRPAGDGKVSMQNVGRALLSGGELSLALIWRGLTLSTGYRFIYSTILAGDEPMDSVPRHRGVLRAELSAWGRLDGNVTFSFTGPFSARDPDSGVNHWIGPAFLLDVRVQIRVLRWLFLFSRASNVLDWNYETAPGQPASGFNLWGGLRVLIH